MPMMSSTLGDALGIEPSLELRLASQFAQTNPAPFAAVLANVPLPQAAVLLGMLRRPWEASYTTDSRVPPGGSTAPRVLPAPLRHADARTRLAADSSVRGAGAELPHVQRSSL